MKPLIYLQTIDITMYDIYCKYDQKTIDNGGYFRSVSHLFNCLLHHEYTSI